MCFCGGVRFPCHVLPSGHLWYGRNPFFFGFFGGFPPPRPHLISRLGYLAKDSLNSSVQSREKSFEAWVQPVIKIGGDENAFGLADDLIARNEAEIP